jgi:orotate phosphoribosyltransferase
VWIRRADDERGPRAMGYNSDGMTAHDEIEELRVLMQRHCVRFGDFTLSSGRKSKYYYNGKKITLRPSALRLVGDALVDVVLAAGADAVGGPELGAVPIATAVGLAALGRGRDLPVFVVRKEQKGHGARDLVVEPYADEAGGDAPLVTAGTRLAIVEDAVTTGGSVQKAIDAVEELGARIVLIAVLVERHEGGGDGLRSRGYDVLSLFRTDEEGRLFVNEEFLKRREAAQAAAQP